MQLDSVRELKSTLSEKLIRPAAFRGIVGVRARSLASVEVIPLSFALGVARIGNDFGLAVRVQSRAPELLPILDEVKATAKGEVDIRYVGRIEPRAKAVTATASSAVIDQQKRQRPMRIGDSVGHYKVTAGTLGGFAKLRSGKAGAYILSNNHVLANENDAEEGDAVLQPGAADKGKNPKDVVAKLAKYVSLRRTTANRVDCAIALLEDTIGFETPTIPGIGALRGLGAELLEKKAKVRKTGRTTGTTTGRVTAFELDKVVVAYDIGDLRFDGQIEIEGTGQTAFSDGGDSGSLIVDDDGGAVAQLFAGADQGGANGQGLTYATPIRAVLDALRIDLLF